MPTSDRSPQPARPRDAQAEPGRPRLAVAALTGHYYRFARRAGIATRASRQAERHRARRLPDMPLLNRVGPDGERPLRVVILGNGPAESPGAGAGAEGFGALVARSLFEHTGRAVEVRTVVGARWDLTSLGDLLHEEGLHWSDVLIVTAAYRPELAEVPLQQWRAYTQRLRAVLVDGTEPGTVIRVLSLPWRHAVRHAPAEWGGTFGNRILVLAETAEAALTPDQPALPLRLHPPFDVQEWVGPEFSPRTYIAWADQIAAAVVPGLPTVE